ncbi:11353_t:CDS:1, partial [Racocetra fulgida]
MPSPTNAVTNKCRHKRTPSPTNAITNKSPSPTNTESSKRQLQNVATPINIYKCNTARNDNQ